MWFPSKHLQHTTWAYWEWTFYASRNACMKFLSKSTHVSTKHYFKDKFLASAILFRYGASESVQE